MRQDSNPVRADRVKCYTHPPVFCATLAEMTQQKPWDARLAHCVIKPFINTPITPNYFTTLRLVTGLLACWFFAQSDQPILAAWIFALSHFLDHTDGELARSANKGSRFGHLYDLASDAVIMVLLFVSIGYGLQTQFGGISLLAGLVAGVAISVIFQLRHVIEDRLGKSATAQAQFAGFEVEDIMYLLPLVAIFGGLGPFIFAAAIGAPIGAVIVIRQFLALSRSRSDSN